MSKPHRGKGVRELAAHGRGTCPVCGATGIKVLYEAGEQKVKVCKPCRAAVKHGKKSVPAPAQTAEPAPAE